MTDVLKIYASMVFNDAEMRKRLPQQVYEDLIKAVDEDIALSPEIGEIVAQAMQSWALEKGATHFTHWFQPMTEVTAEKHDSFLNFDSEGNVKMSFSGKELIKGESDASSLPSGGLRATFEARGYTSWDPTSYAFIKNNSLYIPTFFCSYSGEVLDKKTPLLKSMYALNKQALRILKILKNDKVHKVTPYMGAEQEYFLIDKEVYKKRKDIIFCGRTLFGAKPVKSQDLYDHYFASLRPRVSDFMIDLDNELWKLGVPSKTKHNEVAPAQHEVAQIYTRSNLAADQNYIVMETLKNVAEKHNLVCLLHEKPFKFINGSGKHNNWSLSSDRGINLFEPGKSPRDNIQFLIFLCAMIKAVDEYADLLRISVSSLGNDARLGGQEAPPAIVSMYLGPEIMTILESIESGEIYTQKERGIFEIGLNVFPRFPKDTSDRNRTSPFAFTGNKFEFRMVGSNQSIATPNMILNTIMAESLKEFADILEKSDNPIEYLNILLVKTIKKHKRVIFNGNSYSEKWFDEAKKRGLPIYNTTVDALEHLLDEKNVKLFETHGVLSRVELNSRYEIYIKNYCKMLHIEVQTMISMIKSEILPAVSKYNHKLAKTLSVKNDLNLDLSSDYEYKSLKKLSELSDRLCAATDKLNETENLCSKFENMSECARNYRDLVLDQMNATRDIVDEIETEMPKEYWPYPNYEDILFSV
ncbi:MAG: glutamine synthetase III [Clostridia bacterium]|nr:glutamine synthetase III [Clostridia bacterium]